jgi:hypothetical protein
VWILVSVGFAVTLTTFGCTARGVATHARSSPSASATPAESPTTIPASPANTATPTLATRMTCSASTSGPPVVKGPVTAADLCTGTLSIPSWGDYAESPCPHDTVVFKNGESSPVNDPINHVSTSIRLESMVSADVDHDGVAEAVVVISCPAAERPFDQVVAFGRTATGTIRTLGQVVGPVAGIDYVSRVVANPDGSIRVAVAQVLGSVAAGIVQEFGQWRTYTWTGQRFVQTAGPTSFIADQSTTHLSIKATSITLAQPQAGVRRGSLTVTVKNTGATLAAALTIRPELTEGITVLDQSPCTDSFGIVSCTVGDLAPGATQKISVTVTVATARVSGVIDATKRNPDYSNVIQLLVGERFYAITGGLAITLS